jgi:phage terminase large subunit GpA-like protein
MTAREPKVPDTSQLDDLRLVLMPADNLPMSQWAEKHFRLSGEYSAVTNTIVLDPWQREILDAFSDPRIHQVTLMTATQLIKTLAMQIAMAWAISEQPGPMLFVGYKDDDASKFSKERFTPMCRDIEPLGARIIGTGSRDKNNTIEHKVFPGGSVDFVGSISPANLARRTIRYLFCDEIDKWDKSAGKEGDPLSLAKKRMARFGSRRKMIAACSPTVKGHSRIEDEYENSDQRKPYVCCGKCGTAQILKWSQVRFDSSLPKLEAAAGARYLCVQCGHLWTEQERRRWIRESVHWKPHGPFNGNAGFWVSHLYSLLELHSLAHLTSDFLDSRNDPDKLKTFINTDLAELWTDRGERPEWETVKENAEPYEIGPFVEVDPRIVFLMCGVDVQATRLEYQILGFGPDDDNRLHVITVDYGVIELREPDGLPKLTSSEEYWTKLDQVLKLTFRHPSGALLPIVAMLVDVGHNPDPVYKFAAQHVAPAWSAAGIIIGGPGTVVCIRGLDGEQLNAIHGVSEREAARERRGFGRDIPIVTLGTGFLKTKLYTELRKTESTVHLPAGRSDDFYKGITAEKRVINGKSGTITFEKVFPRNEPLDTWVYAVGGAYIFRADKFTEENWRYLRGQFGIPEKDGTIGGGPDQGPTIRGAKL